MTTESRSKAARPTESWTIEDHRAERARNRSFWHSHGPELIKRYPDHSIVVYGGGTAVAFDEGEELIAHLNALDDFTRGAMYWAWPPRANSRMWTSKAQGIGE